MRRIGFTDLLLNSSDLGELEAPIRSTRGMLYDLLTPESIAFSISSLCSAAAPKGA